MPGKILLIALLALAAVVTGIVVWMKLFRRKTHAGGEFVYETWRAILTPSERLFVMEIEKVLPEDIRVLAKVRLSDVFFTKKDLDAAKRTRARNRINQKHVDFLLVRASDYAPLLGVEFDKTGAGDDRKQRDRFVEEVFAGCHLPLLHIPAAASYQLTEFRALVAERLAAQH